MDTAVPSEEVWSGMTTGGVFIPVQQVSGFDMVLFNTQKIVVKRCLKYMKSLEPEIDGG